MLLVWEAPSPAAPQSSTPRSNPEPCLTKPVPFKSTPRFHTLRALSPSVKPRLTHTHSPAWMSHGRCPQACLIFLTVRVFTETPGEKTRRGEIYYPRSSYISLVFLNREAARLASLATAGDACALPCHLHGFPDGNVHQRRLPTEAHVASPSRRTRDDVRGW